jgi:hypothetical protein
MGLASRVGRMSLGGGALALGGLGFDEVGGDMATLRWELCYTCS